MSEGNFVPVEFLISNKHLLDVKKPQTTYKIEYISKYDIIGHSLGAADYKILMPSIKMHI